MTQHEIVIHAAEFDPYSVFGSSKQEVFNKAVDFIRRNLPKEKGFTLYGNEKPKKYKI